MIGKKLRLLLLSGGLWAQIAGAWSYDFMRLPPSARSAALGGLAYGGPWIEPAAPFLNPALLRPTYHKRLSISVQPYLADITHATVTYAHQWEGIGTFWSGLQYLNYGTLRAADEVGNPLGTFQAHEGVWAVGAMRSFGRWQVGMNLRLPFSAVTMERYRRIGLGADIGVLYEDTARGFSATVVLWSLGTELYRPAGRPFAQPFPTQIQATVSYKLPQAPFRLHLGTIHLERWRLAANDPLQPIQYDISGNPISPPPPPWTEQLLRHLIGGVEIELSRAFVGRFSYHFQRRRELSPRGATALGGVNFGVGLHLRKWGFDYAYSLFFRRASAHTLTLWISPFRSVSHGGA